MTILDKLKTPQKSDRPIPFWSWNDKLEEDELLRQIALMDEAGIGGFFMHARGGLLTEYMGEEWMHLVEACASEAQRRGMGAWCYDENGWPSGFADGKIVAENPDFAMCGLVCETGKAADEAAEGDEAVLAVKKSQVGAMVVKKVYNPYYVDMLNPDCVKSFIAKTHQQYLKALPGCFDGKIKGFFTDEPQFGNGIYPYSPALEAYFQAEYGQSFKACCHLLFCEEEGFEKARYQYWNAVSNLFLTSFCAQVGAWCEKNGVQLTGHAMAEESLFTQMLTSAGVMGVYEHLHLPGIDHLGRCTASSVTTHQAVSAAVQMGRKKLITETFAMCGHGVSFAELRWIAQSQYVRGVNMMCQHLEGYTMRGARKRDYPPAMFYQQSWWEQYRAFNDYFTRLGMLIRESDDTAGVLVIHPMKSAYITYRHSHQSVAELDVSMLQTAAMLDEAHVMWHFGDENMLAGLGRTEGGELWVGEGRYRAVVLPAMYTMDQTTLNLLLDFAKAGGVLFATGPLPGLVGGEKPEAEKSPAALLAPYVREINLAPYQEVQIKNKNVLAGVRRLGGQTVYHLVNNSKTEAVDEEILLKGARRRL